LALDKKSAGISKSGAAAPIQSSKARDEWDNKITQASKNNESAFYSSLKSFLYFQNLCESFEQKKIYLILVQVSGHMEDGVHSDLQIATGTSRTPEFDTDSSPLPSVRYIFLVSLLRGTSLVSMIWSYLRSWNY
tara:strand:- start:1042 stop:1443 length:402 start_codon:yes stop_codon:yes gene_type:complete